MNNIKSLLKEVVGGSSNNTKKRTTIDNEMNKKESDITVYGATSYVAKYACEYLVDAAIQGDCCKSQSLLPSSSSSYCLRLTLGGRNRNKLELLKDNLLSYVAKRTTISEEEEKEDDDSSKKNDADDNDNDIAKTTTESITSTNTLPLRLNNIHELVQIDIFVTDCFDSIKLREMTKRTNVILNCAGPFSKYGGEKVIESCIQTNTHYVDITGEVDWVGSMRNKYSKLNTDKPNQTCRIISLCGFDSIPSDISIYAAVQALRNHHDEEKHIAVTSDYCDHLKEEKNETKEKTFSTSVLSITNGSTYHSCFGMMNGGTLHTALDMPIDLYNCFFEEIKGSTTNSNILHTTRTSTNMSSLQLRSMPYLMHDPLLLTHPTDVRFDNSSNNKVLRDTLAKTEWINQFPINLDYFGGCSIPFFMSVINCKVVHASSIALNYAANGGQGQQVNSDNNTSTSSKFAYNNSNIFTYRERFVVLGFTLTKIFKLISIIPSIIMQLSLLLSIGILKLPYVGKYIANMLLPPGTGLSDDFHKSYGSCEVMSEVNGTVTKTTASTTTKSYKSTCTMKFIGDPGNIVTAQCVCEAALCLLLSNDSTDNSNANANANTHGNKKDNEERLFLPKRSVDGFGTPAELLGDALINRLQNNSVRKVMISTDIIEK